MSISPPLLTTIATRHSVMLERLKTSEFKKFEKFLRLMDEALRKRIAGKELTSFSTARIEKLIKSVMVDLSLINRKFLKELNEHFAELAAYEAEFETRALSQVVKTEYIIPTETQLMSAVLTNPLSVEGIDKGKLLAPYLIEHTDKQVAQVANAIRTGFYQGQTTNQILQKVRGTRKNKFTDGILATANKTANMIVRTSVQHVANQARMETWRQNGDIIDGYMITVTFDGKTSAICRSEGEKREVYEVGKGPIPPLHPFACLGGTKILTKRGYIDIEHVVVGDYVKTHLNRWRKVYTVMARDYDGEARTLINNNGSSVRLTNKHPILTREKGWVEVSDIEGGDVFFNNIKKFDRFNVFRIFSLVPQSLLINSHNIVTDLTEELVSYGIFSSSAGVSSSIKLNNGVVDDEVRVISKNSVLSRIFNIDAIKDFCKKRFMIGRVGLVGFRERVANFFIRGDIVDRVGFFHPVRTHFSNLFGNLWVLFRPVIIPFRHIQVNTIISARLRSVFGGNTMIFAELPNSVIRKPVLSFNHSKAFVKPVMLFSDKFFGFFNGKHNKSSWLTTSCKSIVVYHHKGMVYNLAVEEDETYTANDFVVHNCRSGTSAVLSKKFKGLDKDRTRFSRGDDGVEWVDHDLGYYEWLKTQSKEFQLSTGLGRKRVELLRNGGLTSKRFGELQLHKNFEPMTLKEMRELEPLAFEKAGL